jgi:metal-responsive CopG/Arc/MetJ family transcriptional regulator
MATTNKSVRQSVSLPSHLATKVRKLAKHQRTSTNRVLVALIESGIDSKENQRQRFFDLADRLSVSSDADERKRIKKELARLTFGE